MTSTKEGWYVKSVPVVPVAPHQSRDRAFMARKMPHPSSIAVRKQQPRKLLCLIPTSDGNSSLMASHEFSMKVSA